MSSYLSALPEDVTVTLEVVARSSGSEAELLSESSVHSLPALHPPPCALTGAVPPRLLTGQLTQVPGGVFAVTGAEETLLQPVLETDAALALSLLAHLGPLIALSFIVLLRLGPRTLGGPSITVSFPGAFLISLALQLLSQSYKATGLITTRPNAGTALNFPPARTRSF